METPSACAWRWKRWIGFRYPKTVYEIEVLQRFDGKGETSVTVDGVPQDDGAIPLVDDRRNHSVEVVVSNTRD